jgi:hypothetical protein
MLELLGFWLGVLYTSRVLPETPGDYPMYQFTAWPVLYRGMVVVPLSQHRALHVHHWTITLVMLLLFDLPKILGGFCLCLTLQGLRYRDRFRFIETNPF